MAKTYTGEAYQKYLCGLPRLPCDIRFWITTIHHSLGFPFACPQVIVRSVSLEEGETPPRYLRQQLRLGWQIMMLMMMVMMMMGEEWLVLRKQLRRWGEASKLHRFCQTGFLYTSNLRVCFRIYTIAKLQYIDYIYRQRHTAAILSRKLATNDNLALYISYQPQQKCSIFVWSIFVIGLIHTIMMARSYAQRMPLSLIQRRKGFCVQIEIIENCLAELYITLTTVVGEGDPELTALNYPP